MLDQLDLAPPDPILGLTEAHAADPRPDKINLGVGVYQDEHGRTPVLEVVKEAERRLLAEERTKSYLPIAGIAAFDDAVERLVLGRSGSLADGRGLGTTQTPGGTGALRVAAELLRVRLGAPTVWISNPSWPNHEQVFGAASLRVAHYGYLDAAGIEVDVDRMLADLESARPGDVVVLHGCCHNPTGADPSQEGWRRISEFLAERRLLPVLDLAYLGFVDGFEEDGAGARTVCAGVPDAVLCTSFSKNFGLYRERIGAMTVVTATPEAARAASSQVARCARACWSNPPAHGGAVVAVILGAPELHARWREELADMRQRIAEMRRAFANALDAAGIALKPSGNDFVVRQRGLFSFTGLDGEAVATLRRDHAVFMAGSGRINVAGITKANLPRLIDAIGTVTAA